VTVVNDVLSATQAWVDAWKSPPELRSVDRVPLTTS
jgi:hypothetical protein